MPVSQVITPMTNPRLFSIQQRAVRLQPPILTAKRVGLSKDDPAYDTGESLKHRCRSFYKARP